MKRILGVLERSLEGKQWLVGEKCTFADLAFMPWNDRVDVVMSVPPGKEKFEGFPNVTAWHNRMTSRPTWKKCMETKDNLMNEQQLQLETGRPKEFKTFAEYQAKIKADDEAKGPKQ